MEALQNGQTTSEGGIEGQSAVAASHAMIEKILSEEPRWQGEFLRVLHRGVHSSWTARSSSHKGLHVGRNVLVIPN